MAYTARRLITRAYYTAGVVARRFQTVSGAQIGEGLEFLNDVLDGQGITGSLIPYFKEYSLNAVTGQEKYNIPGLMQIETITFNLDVVRFPMRRQGRHDYFGSSRADNIESLPFDWHIERVLNGADLYIYFLPSDNYPIKIWGKFMFEDVTSLDQDLELVYDRYYIEYLRYAVAAQVCEENQVSMPPSSQKALEGYEKKLVTVSPLDLSLRKLSSFQEDVFVNYGMANLGRGWTP